MKSTQRYRIIVITTALFLTLALLFAASRNLLSLTVLTQHMNPQTPVTLTTAPISTINKPIQISRTGSIANSSSVPIYADSSGQISEMNVTEGQAVKAGQPLLIIHAAAAPTVNQNTGVSQIQVNYDNALKEFNRLQKLYEIGAIPRRQFEIAATQLQEVKERLANTKNSMPSASVAINGFTTITAPIDGIVTGLSTAPGKVVQAGQQLLSLGSGQEVEGVVRLDQNDLYLVNLGTPVTIDSTGQTITGQVSRIYPLVGDNQSPLFNAHIKLSTNPAGFLKSGMQISVHISTDKTAIVPAVPTVSIYQDNQGRNFIYLAVNGKAVLQEVRIGETIGDFTEITSELAQQSMVITSNINAIKDGDAISVMQ